jgi:pimeloyl-ACP methyl ester carboxylesterase
VTVVFVHGLWNGGWCWDLVRDLLTEAAVPSVAPDLPMTSLAEDVSAVLAVVDEIDGPVVLVGHSYGGAVITEAGAHPAVERLVYLAAFALSETESVNSALPDLRIAPTRLGDALIFSEDGSEVSVDVAIGVPLLYNGVPEAEIARSVPLLRPVRRELFRAVPHTAAWRTKPSSYVVCSEDLAVAPDLQRAMAQRATEVLEWPVGHCSAQSHPQLVAALLRR